MWGSSIHPIDVWVAQGPRYQGHHPSHPLSWGQEETQAIVVQLIGLQEKQI